MHAATEESLGATHGAHNPITTGPFQVDMLRVDDPYELSNGHPIYCPPNRRDVAAGIGCGSIVIHSDPQVRRARMDAGYALSATTLRAPDISVDDHDAGDGWVIGAPRLAVEYASIHVDETDLQVKIREFLAAGTKHIWVVRLGGPRRVEVYEPNCPLRIATPGEMLTAPGTLRNPVAVDAMYDRDAAHAATLRNLCQRRGYESFEAAMAKSVEEGMKIGFD